jgi:hypothetical protein
VTLFVTHVVGVSIDDSFSRSEIQVVTIKWWADIGEVFAETIQHPEISNLIYRADAALYDVSFWPIIVTVIIAFTNSVFSHSKFWNYFTLEF